MIENWELYIKAIGEYVSECETMPFTMVLTIYKKEKHPIFHTSTNNLWTGTVWSKFLPQLPYSIDSKTHIYSHCNSSEMRTCYCCYGPRGHHNIPHGIVYRRSGEQSHGNMQNECLQLERKLQLRMKHSEERLHHPHLQWCGGGECVEIR